MNNLDEVLKVITDSWMSLFVMINSWTWLFALPPVVMSFYAISSARKKLMLDAEIDMRKELHLRVSTMELIILQTKYLVVSILALYIIYGTFGMVYAGADTFTYTWDKLVISPWRDLLGI